MKVTGYFAHTAGKRVVEYYVCGSDKPDAKILVECHGGGLSGSFFFANTDWVKALTELNVKTISPSFPGVGYSTVQPGRKIFNWPRDDLDPILIAEKVDKLTVMGTSFGSPHAMATAAYYGGDVARCTGMGLRVPNFGSQMCSEIKALPAYSNALLLPPTKKLGSFIAKLKVKLIMKIANASNDGMEPSACMDAFLGWYMPSIIATRKAYPESFHNFIKGTASLWHSSISLDGVAIPSLHGCHPGHP